MKSNNNHQYAEIDSFEDFKVEKERLIMKRKLIEARLNFSYLKITNLFSFSNLIFAFAKETILPKLSTILGKLIKKVES